MPKSRLSFTIKGVTETTACYLREEIIKGEIQPGTKLNEIELTERYGVSRPPLREAFRKLEQEKLVTSIPRKGTYVTKISVADCKNLYFTRCILESGVIDAIAEKKVRNFDAIERHMDDVKNLLLSRNAGTSGLMESIEGVTAFHLELFETSNNRWLLHLYKNIIPTLTRYQYIYFSISGTQLPSIKDHATILALLKKNEYQDAKVFLMKHIQNSFHNLIETIKKSDIIV